MDKDANRARSPTPDLESDEKMPEFDTMPPATPPPSLSQPTTSSRGTPGGAGNSQAFDSYFDQYMNHPQEPRLSMRSSSLSSSSSQRTPLRQKYEEFHFDITLRVILHLMTKDEHRLKPIAVSKLCEKSNWNVVPKDAHRSIKLYEEIKEATSSQKPKRTSFRIIKKFDVLRAEVYRNNFHFKMDTAVPDEILKDKAEIFKEFEKEGSGLNVRELFKDFLKLFQKRAPRYRKQTPVKGARKLFK